MCLLWFCVVNDCTIQQLLNYFITNELTNQTSMLTEVFNAVWFCVLNRQFFQSVSTKSNRAMNEITHLTEFYNANLKLIEWSSLGQRANVKLTLSKHKIWSDFHTLWHSLNWQIESKYWDVCWFPVKKCYEIKSAVHNFFVNHHCCGYVLWYPYWHGITRYKQC